MIPTELVCKIIDDLEKIYFDELIDLRGISDLDSEQEVFTKKLRDLLACRSVCRTFTDVCTPRAFKAVRVTQNEGRISGFWNCFMDKRQDLAKHVREFIYWERGDEQQTEEMSQPTLASIFSNLHLFPNLDTVRIFFHHYGFLFQDYVNEESFPDDDERGDRQMEEFLESVTISSTYRRQLVIIHSLANSAIKHIYIQGLYQLPTTTSFFISSRRLVTLFSELQTLSIDFTSYDSGNPWDSEFHTSKFWKRIFKLLAGASFLTSLALTSDHYTFGPSSDAWDAMTFPSLTTLKLSRFIFKNGTDFSGADMGVEAFLHRHLQEGSRLNEVVFNRVGIGFDVTRVWAEVYDRIADLVSSSSHPALKTFKHLPARRIVVGGRNHLEIIDYYRHGQQISQEALDLEAYERLQTVLAKYKEV